MAARTMDAFRKEIDHFLDETISEDGRRTIFVSLARDAIDEFNNAWVKQLGSKPRFETFVDGREGAALTSVAIPGGMILHRVQSQKVIIERALHLLDQYTKVVTGDYKRDRQIWVNGTPGGLGQADVSAQDYVDIVQLSVFGRKAEREGFNAIEGAGFPSGLLHGVAAQLQREFPGVGIPIRVKWDDYGGEYERLPGIRIG